MVQALAVYNIGAGGLWETAASQVVLAVCKSMSWKFVTTLFLQGVLYFK